MLIQEERRKDGRMGGGQRGKRDGRMGRRKRGQNVTKEKRKTGRKERRVQENGQKKEMEGKRREKAEKNARDREKRRERWEGRKEEASQLQDKGISHHSPPHPVRCSGQCSNLILPPGFLSPLTFIGPGYPFCYSGCPSVISSTHDKACPSPFIVFNSSIYFLSTLFSIAYCHTPTHNIRLTKSSFRASLFFRFVAPVLLFTLFHSFYLFTSCS